MHFFQPSFGNREHYQTIAAFMALYGLAARDAFQLFDYLQTCAALTGGQPLYMDYLLPLAIARIRPPREGALPKAIAGATLWSYRFHDVDGRGHEIDVVKFVERVHQYATTPMRDFRGNAGDVLAPLVYEMRSRHGGERLADAGLYGDLLDTVGRFTART